MGLFWGYIARFIVKKRTISGNPWHEQKDTIFRDTSKKIGVKSSFLTYLVQ